jgi:hypothetical protein
MVAMGILPCKGKFPQHTPGPHGYHQAKRMVSIVYLKGKAIPLQALTGPVAPRFHDNRHMKVARLSALRTGRLYPQETFLALISVRG